MEIRTSNAPLGMELFCRFELRIEFCQRFCLVSFELRFQANSISIFNFGVLIFNSVLFMQSWLTLCFRSTDHNGLDFTLREARRKIEILLRAKCRDFFEILLRAKRGENYLSMTFEFRDSICSSNYFSDVQTSRFNSFG